MISSCILTFHICFPFIFFIGEPFTCDFTVTPIRNERSEVVLFLCSYQQVTQDLIHPNVYQSGFKMNHSKTHSILSWASELPFSKSYLHLRNNIFSKSQLML